MDESWIQPRRLQRMLAMLYRLGAVARNRLYDREIFKVYRANLPVVCIGNATVGGSGKSPFAQYVARGLAQIGKRPVILSRGYGGSLSGPVLVTSDHTTFEVGDEALMHFGHAQGRWQVVIARSRSEGAKFISENLLGDVIVLDDGYQHRALARDLNILLIDVTERPLEYLLREEQLLPAGHLREPVRDALARANCVVLIDRAAPGSRIWTPPPGRPLLGSVPVFYCALEADRLVDLMTGESRPLTFVAEREVKAVTAIAKPGSFLSILRALGADIVDQEVFEDHYLFTADDWQRICAGPMLIVTAKDAVKLRPFVKASDTALCLELTTEFVTPNQHKEFWSLVGAVLTPPKTERKVGAS